jgi:NADPH-ferrihemoprotein reductase
MTIVIIGGLLFVILGLIIIFLNKSSSPTKGAPSTNNRDALTEDANKKPAVRTVKLEDLVLPSNFPNEVVFYFGSQTGTAEKFCSILEEEANKISGIKSARVIDFEDFKPEVFTKHQLVIVCSATHYEGDPPDNTKKVFKWLKD